MTRRALVDTSVLFASAYRRDADHSVAREILAGVDEGRLPVGVVVDYVLAETLNGLTRVVGDGAAVEFLNRLEQNERFQIERLTATEFGRAGERFRRYEGLSFVDGAIAAFAAENGVDYLYALDDDFDRVESLSRLDRSVDPYRGS